MAYILIVGAKSDIAQALAEKYARQGFNLYLAARQVQELETFAQHLRVGGGCQVELLELDLLDFASHQSFYESLNEKPEGVITAAGYLGEQNSAQEDFDEAKRIIDTNYTGLVSLLNLVANDFEQRSSGFIIGISSVAGDRGRKSNYLYGSAKAAFSAYLSGLRNRLFDSGVHVMTVKPGFVDTKMTQGMDLPEKLTAQPKAVAEDIYTAQTKRRNVLYTKRIWQLIMTIIRLIPEWQFKKMSI